jgi:hypothetical protein
MERKLAAILAADVVGSGRIGWKSLSPRSQRIAVQSSS